jgi:hypothetical protein
MAAGRRPSICNSFDFQATISINGIDAGIWRLLVLAGALSACLPIGASAGAGQGCKCRNAGLSYDLGEVVCIRGQLARCEMFLNNTSWKIIAETCPETRAPSPPETRPQAQLAACWKSPSPRGS